MNEEEFWIYNVVKDFEYVLHKHPEKVLEFSQDAVGMQNKLYKALLTNMEKHFDVNIQVTTEKKG
jgi:hypothetical protein